MSYEILCIRLGLSKINCLASSRFLFCVIDTKNENDRSWNNPQCSTLCCLSEHMHAHSVAKGSLQVSILPFWCVRQKYYIMGEGTLLKVHVGSVLLIVLGVSLAKSVTQIILCRFRSHSNLPGDRLCHEKKGTRTYSFNKLATSSSGIPSSSSYRSLSMNLDFNFNTLARLPHLR